jgi:hypothetical protein
VEVQLHAFLNSALYGSECHFTFRGSCTRYLLRGSWVDQGAGLDAVEKRKLFHLLEIEFPFPGFHSCTVLIIMKEFSFNFTHFLDIT